MKISLLGQLTVCITLFIFAISRRYSIIMIDFDFILETLVTICLSVYYLIEGMVKAVLPINWMPKKDLSLESVLFTGAGKHQRNLSSKI